ncbi:MAG: hypothetical protein V1493_00540, partial [Candidatus Diapherotrites archaeon]
MEQNTFRLAIYGIIVAILLYIFFFHFGPAYIWKEQPQQIIGKQLQFAETQLGQYSHQEGEFREGLTARTDGYESTSRNVTFECNYDILCCPKGEKCSKAIEWDNNQEKRYFSFNETKPVEISARCRHESIYICKVFIGAEPAQVKITESSLSDKELDLTKKRTAAISYKVQNTGKKGIVAAQATALLYKIKKLPYGQEPEKTLVQEFKGEEFALGIGEEAEKELLTEITENGDYLVEFMVKEKTDDTDYETKTFGLKAAGLVEIGACITKTPLEEWFSEKECRYYLRCEDCKSVVECRNKWKAQLGLPDSFGGFALSGAGKDTITLTAPGEYIEGKECEKLCYSDWDVIRELEKSDTPLEVFIVLDASGSMQDEINALKNTIRQIVGELKGGCTTESGEPCIKIGIYVLEGSAGAYPTSPGTAAFKQCQQNCPSDHENDVGQIGLTNKLDVIADSLSQVMAGGGAEPWADVVVYSLKEETALGWNPASHKAIIVMTDEINNSGVYSVEDAVTEINSRGGTANAFAVWSELAGPSGLSFPELDDLATRTGGLSEHYLSETEIPGLLLKIVVHAVRKTARASGIRFCDESICPSDCSCDWWSYPGRETVDLPECAEEKCENCAKEKCQPLCALPGAKKTETQKYEPEEKCTPTECLQDSGKCKTWLLC